MSLPAGPDANTRPTWALDAENLDASMSEVPLFMKELPEEENDTLAALQSLVYDGTPEEIAENFKNQGNECYAKGKIGYADAIRYYTQALDVDCQDKKLNEACYANRAAVNLELQNYGKVLRDCAKCLGLNDKNVKALYRSAKALYALDRMTEAIDCCDHALEVDPENKAVIQEKERCQSKLDQLEEKKRKEEERQKKEEERKSKIDQMVKDRSIKFEVTDESVAKTAQIQIDEETNTLSWPVFFLYPEYKESDYIQAFNETNTFQDHLEVMFEQPAPWDVRKDYTIGNIEVYFENTTGLRPTLVKIGKKLQLGKILSHEKYKINNGVASFIILNKSGAFKDEFLARYKK
ncbi:HSP70/90 co-chaperone [Umbelopsis nana]